MTKLPDGWELKRLSDCLEKLKSGKKAERGWSPQCLSHPSSDENVWGVLKTTSVQMGEFQPEYNKELPDSLAPKSGLEVSSGDFLVTTTGPRNRCGIVCHVKKTRKKLIFSGKILRFRVDESLILPNWLMYLLMSPEYQSILDKMKVGTSDSSVSIGNQQILDLEIPVPPIDEQNKIVELLEDHTSRLDAALADVKQGQKKIKQFRRSFLQDTFVERDGARHCSLGDVVEIKTGKIDANKAVPDGKYPFFTCAREISRIDDAPFDGKVVLVAGNGDLNVKYYEGKFNAYQRTYILKSKNEEILFPKYLFWFMEHYIFELRTLAIGTTIKYIKLGNLMDAKMSLPAINIQKQMVLEIERSLSFVDNSEETFTKLIRESGSLRRAILISAFSGELTNEVSHV
jgi:restriction endonuclease S subunit